MKYENEHEIDIELNTIDLQGVNSNTNINTNNIIQPTNGTNPLSKSRFNIGSVSLNSLHTISNSCAGITTDIIIHFYDIEPHKIDTIVDFCVRPHYIVYIIPIPFWISWAMNYNPERFFFAMALSSTIFSILQTNSFIIKKIYGKPDSFDNFYIKKKITEKTDKYIIETRFQKLFIIIAFFVITLSTFGFIYFQLFDFSKSQNTPAQIFILLFGALASIHNIQHILCSYVLSMLIKYQKYLIKKTLENRNNDHSITMFTEFTEIII